MTLSTLSILVNDSLRRKSSIPAAETFQIISKYDLFENALAISVGMGGGAEFGPSCMYSIHCWTN